MKSQRGGFFLGMIVGLLIGLALALGVALYITKVPLPFIDKVPQRTAEQDAAEAEHNKNWDPNSPLYGKNPAKPHAVVVEPPASAASDAASDAQPSGVESPVAPAPPAPASTPSKAASAAKSASGAASSTRNPAAILSGEPVSTASAPDSLSYQVQAGAYGSQPEAEQQRAKLAMMGLEPRIQEREVNGRTMYRVRLGPFTQREQAEEVRVKLQAAGVESALVRVQQK
jgi:cell division protein FtsN